MAPIRVVISKGAEDVTIKICDRGGGIPRSKIPTIFKFSHSTAGAEENSSDFGVDEVTGSKIRGFGLPLARIYARYLGGELTLKSMEGYGLDAYLHLPRLGDCCENLPPSVSFSPGELDSTAHPSHREPTLKRRVTGSSRSYSTSSRWGQVSGSSYFDETPDDKTRRILEILKNRAL